MSAQSPQDLFPNLFAAKPSARPGVKPAPTDMRLVQFAMRQASKRSSAPVPAPRPSRLAPAAQQGQGRPVAAPAAARRATPTRPTSLSALRAASASPPQQAQR